MRNFTNLILVLTLITFFSACSKNTCPEELLVAASELNSMPQKYKSEMQAKVDQCKKMVDKFKNSSGCQISSNEFWDLTKEQQTCEKASQLIATLSEGPIKLEVSSDLVWLTGKWFDKDQNYTNPRFEIFSDGKIVQGNSYLTPLKKNVRCGIILTSQNTLIEKLPEVSSRDYVFEITFSHDAIASDTLREGEDSQCRKLIEDENNDKSFLKHMNPTEEVKYKKVSDSEIVNIRSNQHLEKR